MSEEAEVKEKVVKIDPSKYVQVKAASGAKSLNNGDNVASCLSSMTMEEVYGVADQLIPGNGFAEKYAALNKGMQRMNVGNRIRGFISKNIKENEKIEKYNSNLGEGEAPKEALEDVGEQFARIIG